MSLTDSRALLSSIGLYLNNLGDTFNVTGSLSFTAEDDYYFVFYNFDSAGSSASVQALVLLLACRSHFHFIEKKLCMEYYHAESVGIVQLHIPVVL